MTGGKGGLEFDRKRPRTTQKEPLTSTSNSDGANWEGICLLGLMLGGEGWRTLNRTGLSDYGCVGNGYNPIDMWVCFCSGPGGWGDLRVGRSWGTCCACACACAYALLVLCLYLCYGQESPIYVVVDLRGRIRFFWVRFVFGRFGSVRFILIVSSHHCTAYIDSFPRVKKGLGGRHIPVSSCLHLPYHTQQQTKKKKGTLNCSVSVSHDFRSL